MASRAFESQRRPHLTRPAGTQLLYGRECPSPGTMLQYMLRNRTADCLVLHLKSPRCRSSGETISLIWVILVYSLKIRGIVQYLAGDVEHVSTVYYNIAQTRLNMR